MATFGLSPQFTGRYYAKKYGVTADGTTDDTGALQEAIDACVTDGIGTLELPSGVIFINGALGGANSENAQLRLPPLASPPAGLRIVGQGAPGVLMGFIDVNAPTKGGTIIKTTKTGGGNLFGVAATESISPHQSFSRLNYAFERFSIVSYDDPDITYFDMRKAACLTMRDVSIYTAKSSNATLPQPTHSSQYGVRCPSTNNAAIVQISNLQILGSYNGIEIAECFEGVGQVFLYACVNGVVCTPMNHGASFTNLQVARCVNGIVGPSSGAARLHVLSLRYEYTDDDAKWYDEDYLINDSGNRLKGTANVCPVQEAVGPDTHAPKNGGTNFALTAV
jgi:hypothetical protein